MTTPPDSSHADDSLSLRAVSGASWTVLQTFVLIPLNFLTSALVARILGPVNFGELASLTLFLAIVSPVVDLGFGAAAMQFAGQSAGRGESRIVNALLSKLLGFHLLWQFPVLTVCGLIIVRETSPVFQVLFVVAMFTQPFTSNASVRLTVDNRMAANAKISLAAGLGGNALLLLLAFSKANAQQIWLGRLLFAVVPALFVLRLLSRDERGSLLRPSLPRRLPDTFWPYARGMWLAVALGAIVGNRVEVYLLRWNGLPVSAGAFAVAFGLATQITAPLDMLQSSLGPAINAKSGRDPEGLRRACDRALPLFGLGASLVLGLSSGLVFFVAILYGDAYSQARTLLIFLLVGSCIQTCLAPFSSLAVARRRRRLLPAAQAACVVVDLGLTIALIPVIGATAAALGAAASLMLGNAILARSEIGTLREFARLVFLGPIRVGLLAFGGGLVVGSAIESPWLATIASSSTSCLILIVGFSTVDRQSVDIAVREVSVVLPPRIAKHLPGGSRIRHPDNDDGQ